MDPLRKGIAIGMLFGSGKEAELNDKEVEIDVGDILDALTGIFTYNPEDEDPQGDPPGPWDGYSLFTIDLTAVKQSLEDIIAALQQHDPDYDPDETPPEDAVEDLIEENEQQEQTIEDLTEQVEECDQCKADVIAKLQEYDPDFDPVTCSDIPPEIDKVIEEAPEEYTFDPEVTIPDLSKIVAGEPIGTPNSNYYLDVYIDAYQWGVSPPQHYTGRTVYATAETGELSARIVVDIVDGNGDAVRHYIHSTGYSIFPSLNGYAQIANYTITNDVISVDMLLYRSDTGGSIRSTTFTDALFADFATGPYTVKKNS